MLGYFLRVVLHNLKKTNNTHNTSNRSDQGLTLEKSAFQIFHGRW